MFRKIKTNTPKKAIAYGDLSPHIVHQKKQLPITKRKPQHKDTIHSKSLLDRSINTGVMARDFAKILARSQCSSDDEEEEEENEENDDDEIKDKEGKGCKRKGDVETDNTCNGMTFNGGFIGSLDLMMDMNASDFQDTVTNAQSIFQNYAFGLQNMNHIIRHDANMRISVATGKNCTRMKRSTQKR